MTEELTKNLILKYAQTFQDRQKDRAKKLEEYIKDNIKTDFLAKDIFHKILEWKSQKIGKRRQEIAKLAGVRYIEFNLIYRLLEELERRGKVEKLKGPKKSYYWRKK